MTAENHNHVLKTRENNLDAMRIFAMIMVIILHVADLYICEGGGDANLIVFLYEGMSHCANPLFLMLTGALVLDKAGGIESGKFWKKSFLKLGVPTIIFTVLTWSYDVFIGKITFSIVMMDIVRGCYQHYPQWYMAMLTGIYFVLPIISRAKRGCSEKTWKRFVIVYFIWSIGSQYFQDINSAWVIAVSLSYLGYVLLGNMLHEIRFEKNNFTGVIMILVGIVIMMMDYYVLYLRCCQGGNYYSKFLWGYKAPLMVCGFIVVFIGFNRLTIKVDMSKLSGYSFVVYLSQKLVITVLEKYRIRYFVEEFTKGHIGVTICVMSVIVFLISYVISVGYGVCQKVVKKQMMKRSAE